MGNWRPGLGIGLWMAWIGAMTVGEVTRRSSSGLENPPQAHDRTPLPLTAVQHAVGEVSRHLSTPMDYQEVAQEMVTSHAVNGNDSEALAALLKPVSQTMLTAGAPSSSLDGQDR